MEKNDFMPSKISETTWCRNLVVARAWRVLVMMLFMISTGCASLAGDHMALDELESVKSLPELEEVLSEGDRALSAGDLDTAQVSYALAVERAPENVEALYKLGFVHSEKGSLDVSATVLRHALLADPEHQAAMQSLAEVMLRQERYEDSEKLYKKLSGLNSSAWEAYNGLGVLYDLMRRHEEAQQQFKQALRLKPRSARVLNNLGYSYYLTGDYPAAEDFYRKALSADSEYERVWSNIALLYSREGRLRDAAAAFLEIVDEHQAANNLGYLSFLQGQEDIAQSQYTRAIQLSAAYYDLANRNMALLRDPNRSRSSESEVGQGDSSNVLSKLEPTASLSKSVSSTASVVESDAVGQSSQRPQSRSGKLDIRVQSRDVSRSGVTKLANIGLPAPEQVLISREELEAYLTYLDYYQRQGARFRSSTLKSAIREYQTAVELSNDGVFGLNTQTALMKSVVRKLQADLGFIGYPTSTVNGEMSESIVNAISQFEADQGLEVTGTLSPVLIDYINDVKSHAIRNYNSSESGAMSVRG